MTFSRKPLTSSSASGRLAGHRANAGDEESGEHICPATVVLYMKAASRSNPGMINCRHEKFPAIGRADDKWLKRSGRKQLADVIQHELLPYARSRRGQDVVSVTPPA